MSKTILLADDSVTIQKVIELTFMDQDHRVAAVSSGDEALARLAESKPDFVIADVHMPGASGYAVARRSKELYPDVPVLLLVGTFEAFDEAKAEASGAEDVLKKPFDSQELLRLVEKLSAKAAPAAPAVPEPVAPQAEADPFDWKEDTAPGFNLGSKSPAAGPSADPDASAEAVDPFPELSTPVAVAGAGSLLDTFAPAKSSAEEPEPVFEISLEESAFEEAAEEPSEVETPEEELEELAASPLPSLSWEPAEEEEAPAEEAEVAEAADSADSGDAPFALSDEDVERIARRVADLVGEKLVRQVAWDVVPDLAEVIIRDRLRELESQVE